MKILVCGDRNWLNREVIASVLSQYEPSKTIIVQGEARGADLLAKDVAIELGMDVLSFPADWEKHGKSAGIIRNLQMLDTKPDLVIAFHNFLPNSKGTKHTVTEANKRLITAYVYNDKGERRIYGIHTKDGQALSK